MDGNRQIKGYKPPFSDIAIGDTVYFGSDIIDGLIPHKPYTVVGHRTYYRDYLIGIIREDMDYVDWAHEEAYDVWDKYVKEAETRLWWVDLSYVKRTESTTYTLDVNKECEK